MHFTYLVNTDEEPTQEHLQSYSHFVVVVVLTDKHFEYAFDNVNLELKSSNSALCWILKPIHLRTAPPGSILHRLYIFLDGNKSLYNLDHSFVAVASRDEISSNPPTGGTITNLFIGLIDDPEIKLKKLREAVCNSLKSTESSTNLNLAANLVNLGISAASLIKQFFPSCP